MQIWDWQGVRDERQLPHNRPDGQLMLKAKSKPVRPLAATNSGSNGARHSDRVGVLPETDRKLRLIAASEDPINLQKCLYPKSGRVEHCGSDRGT